MTQDRRPDSLIGKDSPNQRSGSLLELAKKRLASVDARSDGNEDGDETLRQEALKYISKECLSLPDAEFLKLLSKIEEVLRKKGADIGNVRSESQEALKEIS